MALIGPLARTGEAARKSSEDPGTEGDGNCTVGPEYKIDPVFSLNTGHCDRRVFEQTLADTLVWVWRGYEAD